MLRAYDGVVVEVRDGDTIVADLDLTLDVFKRVRIRVRGYDSPEKATAPGRQATAYLQSVLPRGGKIVVTWRGEKSFDRIVADVRYGILDISETMIAAGHALPWDGEGEHPYDSSGHPR